jgi:hypothetical protein
MRPIGLAITAVACSRPGSTDQCRCVGLGVTSLILNVVGFGVDFAGSWMGVVVAGA